MTPEFVYTLYMNDSFDKDTLTYDSTFIESVTTLNPTKLKDMIRYFPRLHPLSEEELIKYDSDIEYLIEFAKDMEVIDGIDGFIGQENKFI
jgi:hypothetical protein